MNEDKSKANGNENKQSLPDLFEPLDLALSHHSRSINSLLSRLPAELQALTNELMVYRFLKGHKFDEKIAYEKLHASLVFRAQNNLMSIRARAVHLSQSQFPYARKVMRVYPHNIAHGVDKKGQPISIERLGECSVHPHLLSPISCSSLSVLCAHVYCV